jgi:RimJ/RimL family protein N-acetyltransferase
MYTGTKIRLRAIRQEDIPVILKYINDESIKRFLCPGVPFPITEVEEQRWYEAKSSQGSEYTFAIETIKNPEYIGGCGVNKMDWKNSVAQVGIFIGNPKFLDKGYGTDAMKTLIRFIFDQMNAHKIKLNVYSFNERAIRCYEKCGFQTDGVLRKEIFRDGEYHDELVMSILREEYEQTKKKG